MEAGLLTNDELIALDGNRITNPMALENALRALKLGEVSALTPISFMQLPLVAGLAWILFDEAITGWTVAGAAIIFGANAYIAHREARLLRVHATKAPLEAAKPGE